MRDAITLLVACVGSMVALLCLSALKREARRDALAQQDHKEAER
jgi:hypothetical protein